MNAVNFWLNSLEQAFFKEGIQKLVSRYDNASIKTVIKLKNIYYV